MNTFTTLLTCHLIGDFLLQNHWMGRKASSSFVCSVHVAAYSIPFVVAAEVTGMPYALLCAVLVQHWLQDRFALHLKWMRVYSQTPIEKWPTGPLCVDQSMHLGFIGIAVLFLESFQ